MTATKGQKEQEQKPKKRKNKDTVLKNGRVCYNTHTRNTAFDETKLLAMCLKKP
jgi:hypothetical protein